MLERPSHWLLVNGANQVASPQPFLSWNVLALFITVTLLLVWAGSKPTLARGNHFAKAACVSACCLLLAVPGWLELLSRGDLGPGAQRLAADEVQVLRAVEPVPCFGWENTAAFPINRFAHFNDAERCAAGAPNHLIPGHVASTTYGEFFRVDP